MTPQAVVQVISQALMTAFWLSAPLLALAFAVGVVVNIVQIATSMQDASFSTIPRLGSFLAGILFMLPWMMKQMMAYAMALFGDFGPYAR